MKHTITSKGSVIRSGGRVLFLCYQGDIRQELASGEMYLFALAFHVHTEPPPPSYDDVVSPTYNGQPTAPPAQHLPPPEPAPTDQRDATPLDVHGGYGPPTHPVQPAAAREARRESGGEYKKKRESEFIGMTLQIVTAIFETLYSACPCQDLLTKGHIHNYALPCSQEIVLATNQALPC